MRINALITSAPRSAMRFASSCTVMVSGMTTSRTTLTCSCWLCCSRWRSRSRARRTEARLRTRSSSSSSARVTVSLPVRRRISSRRSGAIGFLTSTRAPRRPLFFLFLLFFLFFGQRGDLAGGGQRRNLGGRRLAGPLGHLAPRFLFLTPRLFLGLAARLLLLGLAARLLLLGLAARLLFLGLAARLLLGPAARLLGGALLFLPAPVGFGGKGGAPARFLVGLAGILQRAHPPRPLLGGQGAGGDNRAADRLSRRRPRRRRLARDRRRGLGPCRLGRAGHERALFADLDGDGLGTPVREALAHLPGLHPFAQLEPAAGAAQSQRSLPWFVCFAHFTPIP